MTETQDSTASTPAKKRPAGLSSMLIADLRSMAAQQGVGGAATMKKAQLIEAIKAAQPTRPSKPAASRPAASRPPAPTAVAEVPPAVEEPPGEPARAAQDNKGQNKPGQDKTSQDKTSQGKPVREKPVQDKPGQANQNKQGKQGKQPQDKKDKQDATTGQNGNQNGNQSAGQNANQGGSSGGHQNAGQNGNQNGSQVAKRDVDQGDDGDDDEAGTGRSRNRRRRGRDRNRVAPTGGAPTTIGANGPAGAALQRGEPDTTVLEDDVLVPAAGILDVLDNYAFVRTSGYLPGPEDVYLSLSMVRRFGLRRGDAVVGQVRQPREGERREKFNPMVHIDNVNGIEPDTNRQRAVFDDLTPVHPSQRLRLETDPANLVGRVLDVAAPIGKGQRALVVAPATSGKTTLLQSVAASVATNHPECHVMVVLVDERPEEVTEFERAVKGEVIASTFDRPASDHITVAELAIERAKRLVELGHDVVVLLDGLTRLARAYNLTTSGSGRTLSGGVDAAALYPPKRFFGAARNVEDGGSLTILATAQVGSGSLVDEVIFEELTGTANAEIVLSREIADKRLFPAIDVVRSNTRHEELLMSEQESAIIAGLRRSWAGIGATPSLADLLQRLKGSKTNIEFLTRVQRSGPST